MAEHLDVAVQKRKPKAAHPPYLDMAKDAILSLDEKKGASVTAIQTYIAGKYAIEIDTVRQHLKPALTRGLEIGTLERPKHSDAKGYTGRFKINKTKPTVEDKLKEKEKVAKAKKESSKKAPAASKSRTKIPVAKGKPVKSGTVAPKSVKTKLKTPKSTPKAKKLKRTPSL